MTHYEMAEKLSEKMGVSLEKATEALEACDWELLDAALMLEKERGGEKEAYSTKQAEAGEAQAEDRHERGYIVRNIGRVIRKIVLCGNRNRFEVRRKNTDEVVLDLPVTILVVLLLCAFWVCVPLLVIGLFAGFRYAFNGAELGRESINKAMDKAAAAADRVVDEIRHED